MAFNRGVEIKRPPKNPHPAPEYFSVRIANKLVGVRIRHVSHETMNRRPARDLTQPLDSIKAIVKRMRRRLARRVRMKLRKRRGWR